VTLTGDIPFFIASANVDGFPEPEARHYIYLSTFATLRTRPLVPINRPWTLVGGTSNADNVNFGAVRAGANADVLNLVSTAYRPTDYIPGKPSQYTDNPASWRQVVGEMERVHMHWDPSREIYVRADGSVLPRR
jgi:hypothetical protein